jgi:cytochrome oxidase Cu insertion factor (SCO1/SenC/PrrC family)
MTHSLPHTAKSKKPFWVLLILLLLFAVPLLLAWFFTAENDHLGQGTTNHGQLLLPPLDLSKLDLRDTQSQPIAPSLWKGRWLMLYVSPGTCNEACAKGLYYLRQIRTATGKHSERVQRGVLTFSGQPTDIKLQQMLSTDFAGTLHLVTTSAAFTNFIHNTPNEKLALQQGGIYLVDPLGNVLMWYQQNTDPMGIYKDLMRLLKISNIG